MIDYTKVIFDGYSFKLIIEDEEALIARLKEKANEIAKELEEQKSMKTIPRYATNPPRFSSTKIRYAHYSGEIDITATDKDSPVHLDIVQLARINRYEAPGPVLAVEEIIVQLADIAALHGKRLKSIKLEFE